MKKTSIPDQVELIMKTLEEGGFLAYLVGGCVRDLILEREVNDWDIATDARPEEVQKLFPDSVYENKFGTVGIKVAELPSADYRLPATDVVEVTTFRIEGKYSDKRHPDEIKFAETIEEDLSRRDFTVNAMALRLIDNRQPTADDGGKLSIANHKLIPVDIFGGREDLKKHLIRAVGDPKDRFGEDALRMLRAVRFSCQLEGEIEKNTAGAIKEQASLLRHIAKERIRDEFVKMIMTKNAALGIQKLYELGLLPCIIPELLEGIGVGQNKHHIFSVWEHNLKALEYAALKGYSLEVRLASLLHDIGKPRTKKGEGENSTFYMHEYVGAKMTRVALENLRFPKKTADHIVHLVRHHLFYYNVGEVTEAGVRRFLARVGPEYVDDLLKVREADRIGSGVPKAFPYKLRHLLFMMEKVKKDPISAKMVALDGNELMTSLSIPPSQRVGMILSILLDEVIFDPKKNEKEILLARAKELQKLSDEELKKMSQAARERKEEFESGIEEEMKQKYHVS